MSIDEIIANFDDDGAKFQRLRHLGGGDLAKGHEDDGFHPGARGRAIVDTYQAAAERYGYVVVGCGAYTTTTGAGQLLWKMQPFKDPADGKNKCTSASKDHVYSSPGSIMSYVFNLRAY